MKNVLYKARQQADPKKRVKTRSKSQNIWKGINIIFVSTHTKAGMELLFNLISDSYICLYLIDE